MNLIKRLWLSAGIIAASIVIAAAVLVFVSFDLSAEAGKIVSARAASQASTAALGRLAGLEHDAAVAATYQAAIHSLLPTQPQLITIPSLVAAAASEDGVTASFAFQGNPQAPPAGSIGTVPFSLTVQGPLSNEVSFLQDIETKATGFIVNFSSLTLENSNASSSQVVGQGVMYFQ